MMSVLKSSTAELTDTIKSLIINRKTHLKTFLFLYITTILIYQFFINNNLINDADTVYFNGFFTAGSEFWEIRLGRFSLPFFDRLFAGVKSEPYNTYLALLLLTLSIIILFSLFSISKTLKYFLSLFIVTSPTIYFYLSYKYCSTGYMMAMLFSVLCTFSIFSFKNRPLRIFTAILFSVISLSFYQYFIAVSVTTFTIKLIFDINNNKKINFKLIIDFAISIIISFILYRLIWIAFITILKLKPTDYRGVNETNIITIIRNLPTALLDTYKVFFNHFIYGSYIKYNIFNLYIINFIPIILIIVDTLRNIYINCDLSHKDNFSFYFSILLIFIIPVSLSFVNLLTPGNKSLPATGTIALITFIPLISTLIPTINFYFKPLKIIVYVFLVFILHCQVLQMCFDFNTMYKSKEATKNVLTLVSSALINKKYMDGKHNIVIYGSVTENELYYLEKPVLKPFNIKLTPNSEAILLKTNDEKNAFDWNYGRKQAYYKQYLGLNMNLAYGDTKKYLYILDTDLYKNAKPFPSDEAFIEIDDTVIVKLSD